MTTTRPALFTRADGRERIGISFWDGMVSAVAGTAIGFVAAVVATFVLVVAVVLATGHAPSRTPGHPLVALSELVFYGACGMFVWYRLRSLGRTFFRPLNGRDVRVLLLGIVALFAIRFGTVALLIVSNQTKHVQAGFEHFSVTSTAPTVTAFSVVLAVATMVVVAPVVEEIVFRGLLFGALAPRLGVFAAAVVTALLFGFVHGDPVLFPALAALGFVAALAYAATGNLIVPIILHALNNTLGAAFLIATSLRH